MVDKVLPVDREALGKWLFDNRDNLRYTQDWADLTPSTQEMWRQKADALIASPVLRALAEAVIDFIDNGTQHPTGERAKDNHMGWEVYGRRIRGVIANARRQFVGPVEGDPQYREQAR